MSVFAHHLSWLGSLSRDGLRHGSSDSPLGHHGMRCCRLLWGKRLLQPHSKRMAVHATDRITNWMGEHDQRILMWTHGCLRSPRLFHRHSGWFTNSIGATRTRHISDAYIHRQHCTWLARSNHCCKRQRDDTGCPYVSLSRIVGSVCSVQGNISPAHVCRNTTTPSFRSRFQKSMRRQSEPASETG